MSLLIGMLDDDERILFTFRAMAGTQNWKVMTSTKFEDAQKWFLDGLIDILLLDYHMPRINGMEALKILKETNPSIPILILTVELDSSLAGRLLAAGADDFITKPIRLADFVSRMRLHEKIACHRGDGGFEKCEKGMSAETRKRIVESLENVKHPATIKEISALTGLAYKTTHRYLDFLYQQRVLSRIESAQPGLEGKPGRPVLRYTLFGSEGEGDPSC